MVKTVVSFAVDKKGTSPGVKGTSRSLKQVQIKGIEACENKSGFH